MGGHAAGEVASATAVKALRAAFEATDQRSMEALASAAKAANRAVWEQARTNRGMFGMGTTLVALAVVERDDGTNGLAVAHIGDSRAYQLRHHVIRQLTIDHSLVQELVDDGQISVAQALVHPQRHVLTRALGVEPTVDVDIIDISPEYGDRYLLCSDGLSREASDDQIAAVLARFADPCDAAKELVALANSRGGNDNVTAVVVDVMVNEEGPVTTAASGSPGATGLQPAGDTTEALLVEGPSASPPDELGNRKAHREGSWANAAPYPRRLTWRVAGFVFAVCTIVGGATGCLAWYARSAYYVALTGGRVSIYQGRPGGVLWFQPTLAQRTSLSASSVPPHDLLSLRSGETFASLANARVYVERLVIEEAEARASTPASARGAPRSHSSATTTRPTSLTAPSGRAVTPALVRRTSATAKKK
jgi:protein phosphatase